MAAVSWSEVAKYFEDAFPLKGRVERRDVMDLADADLASDDVIDAIDAIGSRVFPTIEAAKEFLTSQGYISG